MLEYEEEGEEHEQEEIQDETYSRYLSGYEYEKEGYYVEDDWDSVNINEYYDASKNKESRETQFNFKPDPRAIQQVQEP